MKRLSPAAPDAAPRRVARRDDPAAPFTAAAPRRPPAAHATARAHARAAVGPQGRLVDGCRGERGATAAARDAPRPVRRDRGLRAGLPAPSHALPDSRRARPSTTDVGATSRPQPAATRRGMPATDPRCTDRTGESARHSSRPTARRVRPVAHLVGLTGGGIGSYEAMGTETKEECKWSVERRGEERSGCRGEVVVVGWSRDRWRERGSVRSGCRDVGGGESGLINVGNGAHAHGANRRWRGRRHAGRRRRNRQVANRRRSNRHGMDRSLRGGADGHVVRRKLTSRSARDWGPMGASLSRSSRPAARRNDLERDGPMGGIGESGIQRRRGRRPRRATVDRRPGTRSFWSAVRRQDPPDVAAGELAGNDSPGT